MKIGSMAACMALAAALLSFMGGGDYDLHTVRHTVSEGQTIWGIAAKYMDKQDKIRDIREMVWYIRETNKLKSCWIHPGDVVMVPLWTKK